MRPLRIGTRGSAAGVVAGAARSAALLEASAGAPCEIVIIKTAGDRLQDAPLSEVGGKRLFVKEIEDALLSGDDRSWRCTARRTCRWCCLRV